MQKCIAVAAGKNCTEPLHVLFTSIFENNKDSLFWIFILYIDLDKADINFYKDIIEQTGNKVTFVPVQEGVFPDTEYAHITKETFLRLFIPALLPANVERILYLDYDTVVQGSLGFLFEEPFGKYSLMAAQLQKNSKELYDLKRSNGIPSYAKYFNAGVLVMNLEKLRRDKHFQIEFVNNYLKNDIKRLKQDDQGYLNHFLWKNTKYLNYSKYNYNAAIYTCLNKNVFRKCMEILYLLKNEKQACRKAIIIHYRGERKPWHTDYNGQCAHAYWLYAHKAGYARRREVEKRQQKEKYRKICQLIFGN